MTFVTKYAIKKRELLIILLSIALFFPFLPALFPIPGTYGGGHGNEILPLSILFLLLFPNTRINLLPLGGLFVCFVCLAFLLDFSVKATIDFIQVIVVLSSLFLVSKLSITDIIKIEKYIFRFSIVLIVFMVLQKLFPENTQAVTNIFSQRNNLVVDMRTGGVRGFAPEPAYMGALLISFFSFSWWASNQIILSRLLLFGSGIFLTLSISAVLTFSFLLAIQFIYRIFLTKDIKFYEKRHIFYLSLLSVPIFATLDFSSIMVGIQRFEFFLDLITVQIANFDIEAALMVEKNLGSSRLENLYTPLSEVCCGAIMTLDYIPSYSLYGKFWSFFAPLHFIALFYFIYMKKMSAVRLVSLLLSLVYGPILFFLLYIGLINQKPRGLSAN